MGKVIWWVDDQIYYMEGGVDLLRMEGYEVRTFDHPRKVLDAIEEGRRPDLLITDFQMPWMDGAALSITARAFIRGSLLPIIMITGFSGFDSDTVFPTDDRFRIFGKPVSFRDDLLPQIQEWIGG